MLTFLRVALPPLQVRLLGQSFALPGHPGLHVKVVGSRLQLDDDEPNPCLSGILEEKEKRQALQLEVSQVVGVVVMSMCIPYVHP